MSDATDQELDHGRIDPKKMEAAVERVDAYLKTVDLETAAELGWEPPTVLPPLWELVIRVGDGAKYRNETQNLTVIVSVGRELDGRRWIHMSMSHDARLPKWRDLREAKDLFIGRKRAAVSVLPSEDQYVNLHPCVLHLFSCLDDNPLPDFTRGTGSL